MATIVGLGMESQYFSVFRSVLVRFLRRALSLQGMYHHMQLSPGFPVRLSGIGLMRTHGVISCSVNGGLDLWKNCRSCLLIILGLVLMR